MEKTKREWCESAEEEVPHPLVALIASCTEAAGGKKEGPRQQGRAELVSSLSASAFWLGNEGAEPEHRF